MCRREHQVAGTINELALSLGIGPPQHEYNMLTFTSQMGDHMVGEHFPSPSLVRQRLVGLNRERGIEKQDTLLSPS